MYIKATLLTVAAWFVGMILDVNIDFRPENILCLRVLFPILAMGLCILKAIKENHK